MNSLILFLIFSYSLLSAESLKNLLKQDHKIVDKFSFEENSPLKDRIKEAPSFVIQAWEKWDKQTNYVNYALTPKERKIVETYFQYLPPLHKKTLKKRLLGIYIVENFLGSGATDWAIDKDGEVYCYMIFSPQVFKKTISELVTDKEKTCFQPIKNINLKITISDDYNGFLYILLHESTHVVDYVNRFTPYPEKNISKIMRKKKKKGYFTRGVWAYYEELEEEVTFLKKDKITFYGFNKGPKISIKKAKSIYKALLHTPFISLYGTLNWAEDFAEYVTFYHLVNYLDCDYSINFSYSTEMNSKNYTYRPLHRKSVKRREKYLEPIYLKEQSK